MVLICQLRINAILASHIINLLKMEQKFIVLIKINYNLDYWELHLVILHSVMLLLQLQLVVLPLALAQVVSNKLHAQHLMAWGAK